jgi:hypothetical protein
MRHNEEEDDDSMPGQDSFVDVICNMVGILITLVVVVGIRVSQVVIEPPTEVTPVVAQTASPEKLAELKAELTDAFRARGAAEDEIETAILQARDMRANSELVEMRREQLTIVRAQVEQSIAERRAELDAESQKQFDAQRQIAEAQIKLNALMQEQLSILSQPANVEKLECVPTPIAKGVSGDSIHVRLSHGQLAVIPVAAFVDEFKARGTDYLRSSLATNNEAKDTYGPINGFRMRYQIIEKVLEDDVPGNSRMTNPQRKTLLQRLIFLPTDDDIGIALEQALLPGSEFSRALQDRKSPSDAVIAWVYTDSFEELRLLKKALWDTGVPLAVLPQLPGQQITFSFGSSGEGLRAVAQ